MERDRSGGRDYGRDDARDIGDEGASSFRDTAPDVLAPIDISSPVSGHNPAHVSPSSISESPEHDWTVAEPLLFPLLRPTGTHGLAVTEVDAAALAAEGTRSHSQPL